MRRRFQQPLWLLGSLVGLLLGMWGSQALVRLLSTSESVITVNSTPTLSATGAAGALALVIALAITAFSAMCALRAEAGDALRAAPRGGGASAAERRLGAMLVSLQVALSLTLVVGASLFPLNLQRLLTQPGRGTTTARSPGSRRCPASWRQVTLASRRSATPRARGGKTPQSTTSRPTSAASGPTSTRCRTITSTRLGCDCWPAGPSIVATRRRHRPSSSSTPG